MIKIKRFLPFFCVSLIFLFSITVIQGASGDVDAGFNPKFTLDEFNYAGNVVLQPDGKILVFGAGVNNSRPIFTRLNVDGSVDSTFDCPMCRSIVPSGVAVQADGKILVGGNRQIIRVDQSGNLDVVFNTNNINCSLTIIVAQPDGKSLVNCYGNNISQETVRRFDNNGNPDTSFATITLSSNFSSQTITQMSLLPDGKILLGGGYQGTGGGWISRYNANGTLDPAFQTTVSGRITGIGWLPDGKYLIVGGFNSVNGTSRNMMARLFTDGSVDQSFTGSFGMNQAITGLQILPNGQFYIKFYTSPFPVPGNNVYAIIRYNANGSIDYSFTQFLNPESWAADESKVVVSKIREAPGIYKLSNSGSADAAFSPIIVTDGYATTAALQADGKVVIAGEFKKTNRTNSVRFARVNSDGTTDTTFNSGSGFDAAPTVISIQPDGKILASGSFTVYNGTPRSKIVRINADGSLDTAFNPGITGSNSAVSVNAIAPLANGKVLIGGNFNAVNGITQNGFAQLNADGSLNTSFTNVFLTGTIVYTIYVQTNGQIMVGGVFGSVNGSGTSHLARLNVNGDADNSFIANHSPVAQVFQRADGKYIISNKTVDIYFNTVTRLTADGSIDYAFNRPIMTQGQTVNTILQQANGNIVFGGNFYHTAARPVANVGRIGPNGEKDAFFPVIGTNGAVNKILSQADGKILFVGNFSQIENVGRPGIARVALRSTLTPSDFDYDGNGRADVSVFRPSTGIWYTSTNPAINYGAIQFGIASDKLVPADYDGDGKTDVAVFRDGRWYLLRSQTGFADISFGLSSDVPVPADYDGDGKADVAVFRPSNGTWYLLRSSLGYTAVELGLGTDKPVPADYDGDGKAEPAVYRPSNGTWYNSTNPATNYGGVQFGQSEDKPVPADYDGDGKIDRAVFRPSNGTWYLLQSTAGFAGIAFGLGTDLPTAADYDGDGKADVAVFRNGNWYLNRSTNGFAAIQFGVSNDKPTPNSFVR